MRRNRVQLMLSDAEYAQLDAIAKERRLPIGTVAYEIVYRSLQRRA